MSQTSPLFFFACGLWHRNGCCIPGTVACQRNIAIDWLSVIYFARTEEWSGHSSSSLQITGVVTPALCSWGCNALCRKWCLREDWTIMASIVQRMMMSTVFWNGSFTHCLLFCVDHDIREKQFEPSWRIMKNWGQSDGLACSVGVKKKRMF